MSTLKQIPRAGSARLPRIVRRLVPPPMHDPTRRRAEVNRLGALPSQPGDTAFAEGGATVAAEPRPLFPSLATLLAGHVLRDGEVVLLILKPSLWYILFTAMRFGAAALIAIIAAELWIPRPAAHWYVEAGLFLLGGRFMWSVLQWMGRLYVLTDYRILRLSGIFTIEIFDCPLRKVGQTRVTRSSRERLWRLGSIEILPQDESRPSGIWQTIRDPIKVHERIRAAISRSKNGF